MSEKRFVQCEIEYGFANTTNIKKIDGIFDMQEEKTYRIEQIVDVLNEQQAIISQLKEENEQLKELLKNYEYQIEKGYTDLTYEEILEKESESDE